jgi:hypothetical protein
MKCPSGTTESKIMIHIGKTADDATVCGVFVFAPKGKTVKLIWFQRKIIAFPIQRFSCFGGGNADAVISRVAAIFPLRFSAGRGRPVGWRIASAIFERGIWDGYCLRLRRCK